MWTSLFTIAVVIALAETAPMHYGFMVDAGSSHSTLQVYTWPASPGPPFAVKAATDPDGTPWTITVRPGISSYADDPLDVVPSMQKLLSYAESKIPSDAQSQSLAFIFATAGMRLLPEPKQESIWNVIRKTFATSPFHFEPTFARTIHGMEEGAFGWITVNYLGKHLGKEADDTRGALDMGGASTQITFYPGEPVPIEYGFNVSWGNMTYELYTHSYLGFGADQARFRANQTMNRNGKVSPDGCLPQGYTNKYIVNNHDFELVGVSNYVACANVAIEELHLDTPCEWPHCGINGTFQPAIPSSSKFVGLSGYYYYSSFLMNSSDATHHWMLGDVREAAEKWCALDYQHVLQHGGPEEFLLQYCWDGSYMLSVARGLGFEWTSDIDFAKTIDGAEIGWALGAMIYEADLFDLSLASEAPGLVLDKPLMRGYRHLRG